VGARPDECRTLNAIQGRSNILEKFDVLATANADGPAKKWAAEINRAINESKMQLIG
jgi:hypothetical protein